MPTSKRYQIKTRSCNKMNSPDLVSVLKALDEEIIFFVKATKDFEIRLLLLERDQSEGLLLVTGFKAQWFSWPENLMTWYPLVFTSSLCAVFQWVIGFCIEIKFFLCAVSLSWYLKILLFLLLFCQRKTTFFYLHLTLCNTAGLVSVL